MFSSILLLSSQQFIYGFFFFFLKSRRIKINNNQTSMVLGWNSKIHNNYVILYLLANVQYDRKF